MEASSALLALLELRGQAVEPSSTLELLLVASGLLLKGLEVDALVPRVVVLVLVFVVLLELDFVEPLELSVAFVFVELDLLLELFVHLCTLEVV